MTVAISALMCTRNRHESIAQAVGSVLANEHPSFELIVVDQSTDERTREALAPHMADTRLRYVHVDRAGLSAAYNTGISLAEAETIACTDDDCIAPAEWLTSVEAAFARHPDADLLYGQTVSATDIDMGDGHVPGLEFTDEVRLGRGGQFYIYGMGANFATKRALWTRLGGFDEMLGGGGPLKSSQDFDYQYRAYKAGAICLLTPHVRVVHYGLRSASEWPATMVNYGVGDGAFYFKHVRCGDLTATRLMASRFGRTFARSALSPLRGKGAEWTYLRSFLRGMRDSLSFRIDRSRRLYLAKEAAR